MNDAEKLELPRIGPAGHDPIWDAIHDHYDRSGNPISMRDWMRLRMWDEQYNHQYRIVKQETIGDYWISTVWIGLNHGYGEGPPLIFETMVFKDQESDLACDRYPTETQAIEGHEKIAAELRLFNTL